MALFKNMAITTKGMTLYAKAQAGQEIRFTKLQVGSGQIGTQNPATLNTLIDAKLDVPITSITPIPELKSARIVGNITNKDVLEAIYIAEIGLFADDPDEGEILYGYASAGQYGDYYAPESQGPYSWQYEINAAIGNAANVTAELSLSNWDYSVTNSNTTFIKISGGNQKEINKSIDDWINKHELNFKKIDENFEQVNTHLDDMKKEIETIDLSANKVKLSKITGMNATEVQAAIQELFQNASNNKQKLVDIITGLGETANIDMTYEQLYNILKNNKLLNYHNDDSLFNYKVDPWRYEGVGTDIGMGMNYYFKNNEIFFISPSRYKKYNFLTNTWSNLDLPKAPDIINDCYYYSLGINSNIAYFYLQNSSSDRDSYLLSYNLNSKTWSTRIMPRYQENFSKFSFDNLVYNMFTSYDFNTEEYFVTLSTYNLISGTFTTLKKSKDINSNRAVTNINFVNYNNELYILICTSTYSEHGNSGTYYYYNNLYKYDKNKNEYIFITSDIKNYNAYGYCSYKNLIILVSGGSSTSKSSDNLTVSLINMDTKKTEFTSLPFYTGAPFVYGFNDRLYVFGGSSNWESLIKTQICKLNEL